MHKILAGAIAALLLITAAPVASASHTATATYDVPSGTVYVRAAGTDIWTISLTTRLCAEEWDTWTDDPEDEIDEALNLGWENSVGLTCSTGRDVKGSDSVLNVGVFGSGVQATTDSYFHHVMSINDDNFDNTFSTFCLFTGTDNFCDDDDVSTTGCGALTLTTPVGAGGPENGPSIFVEAVFVDADTLETCFGTSGEATYIAS